MTTAAVDAAAGSHSVNQVEGVEFWHRGGRSILLDGHNQ